MALDLREQAKSFVKRYEEVAFLVDFDGTLVDLVPHPDEVIVPKELKKNIGVLSAKSGCAFAIITGRTIERLDYFLDGASGTAVGSHGAEYRLDRSSGIKPLTTPIPESVRNALQHLAKRHECIFEDKGYSLSLHLPFNQMNKNLNDEIRSTFKRKSDEYFIRKTGRTYEILRNNITKGTGIRHLMQQPGFSGRKPIYIGDDVYTDESLQIISQMNGLLFPVHHQLDQAANRQAPHLSVTDVRAILRALL